MQSEYRPSGPVFVFRCQQDWLDRIDEVAKIMGTNRSRVIRGIIKEWYHGDSRRFQRLAEKRAGYVRAKAKKDLRRVAGDSAAKRGASTSGPDANGTDSHALTGNVAQSKQGGLSGPFVLVCKHGKPQGSFCWDCKGVVE